MLGYLLSGQYPEASERNPQEINNILIVVVLNSAVVGSVDAVESRVVSSAGIKTRRDPLDLVLRVDNLGLLPSTLSFDHQSS